MDEEKNMRERKIINKILLAMDGLLSFIVWILFDG